MKLTRILATALSVAFLASTFSTALASAPFATTSTPGFYRFKVGDFEVTTISDGTVDLPMTKLLLNMKPEETKKILAQNFLGEMVETSDNAFLINTGTKLVLVDTGAGSLFGPTLGKFHANLLASGYKPEQIDAVVITHMHADHVGGLAADGKMLFPNATLFVDKAESDYWLSEENMNKAPAEMKGFFQGAMASFGPYIKAGKMTAFTKETEIAPGVKTRAEHGHTPGHSNYVVESKGQKLVLVGDIVHCAAVQFANPGVAFGYDSDSKVAVAKRQAVFAEAAKGGYMIGAAHLPFPGIGHIRAEKKAFAYVPANYTR